MPRPWRIEYAGACYHVINRGNYRRNLFTGKGSAEAFERTLGEAAARFGWRVHAYVVMSNHFHLAVELTEPNLSDGMKWLQGTWIRRYNGLRQLIGRPFQGRYKALLVEPGEAFGRVCHYIHLNPVRAGIVPATQPAQYPWGSLPRFLAKDRPKWLEASAVLAEAGGLPDTPKGWLKYLGYLEFLAEDEPSRKTLVAERLSRGWCVGGGEFKAEMKRGHLERGAELERLTGLEPAVVRTEREASWEERLGLLAKAAKVDLSRLPPPKSHPDKVRLAAALKQSTSVSNGWLAARLGMGQPASASQFVRRHLLRPEGRAAIANLLSRVKT
jgi:REP element-mobilizing transposase RayT